jgi:alpha-galactosidase
MLGAGSGFTPCVAKTLVHPVLRECAFVLVDPDEERLRAAGASVRAILRAKKLGVRLSACRCPAEALDGADYVIGSCEINRNPFWLKDIEIPERHGVHQFKGENGGPGGFIHGLRNIALFQPILREMERRCPEAWLLNFTNPESILLTYFLKHSRIRSAGFCHQVHGVLGVISEMMGHAPGELQGISVGINHLNWLFDLRRRSTGRSCLAEFERFIQTSPYWTQNRPDKNLPRQRFSLEVWKTFGLYPLGYDDHILEYMPFFYERDEWEREQFGHLPKDSLKRQIAASATALDHTLQMQHLMGRQTAGKPPFPRNPEHRYYDEAPGEAIVALETNRPLFLDACVGFNHGAADNLPADAVVDRPVVIVGGEFRSVHVGALPPGPAEICRRQIALHEMTAQAAVAGDADLAVQALCLDPYVRSLTQARAVWADYLREYRAYLPMFRPKRARPAKRA